MQEYAALRRRTPCPDAVDPDTGYEAVGTSAAEKDLDESARTCGRNAAEY